jgi:hypothetical protein
VIEDSHQKSSRLSGTGLSLARDILAFKRQWQTLLLDGGTGQKPCIFNTLGEGFRQIKAAK